MAHVNITLVINSLLGCSYFTSGQYYNYKKNCLGGVVIGYNDGKDKNKHF